MKSILFILAAICAPWQEEIQILDDAIAKLTNEYNLHRAKADQQEDLGQRLQFNMEVLDEARLAFKMEDRERRKMAQIQEEIDLLEQKKQQILKENTTKP